MGAAQIQQVFANLGNPLSESKLWKIFERYDTDQVNSSPHPQRRSWGFTNLVPDEPALIA